MQPPTWYLQRLQAMSGQELAWRAVAVLRDRVDQGRLLLGLSPAPAALRSPHPGLGGEPPFRLSDVSVGEWAPAETQEERAWQDQLLHQADQIARHRLSFFDLVDHDLGDPIDWNRDHATGHQTPVRFAPRIDYRDHQVTGDAKVVWEPNRHHQLVVLARAYRTSGHRRYAEAALEQLRSWLDQCPFGMGMSWRSPLELAIRLINWVWTIDLIRESGLLAGKLHSRLLEAVFLQLRDITRKYSRGSSANNHLVGEAAGVFIATSYFGEFPHARRWQERSHRILSAEILAQTYPDGGTREHALGYHLFVLQLFLLAGLVARRIGRDFPGTYWSRLERMLEFVGALCEGGALPMFGDCDNGYVLDLGGPAGDAHSWLAVGAIIFQRPDFKAWAGGYREAARWLLGCSSRAAFEAIPSSEPGTRLGSRAFADSGHYLLQGGRFAMNDRISVTFDCGGLGFGSIAAHGHADALSFTLRAFGTDVFVDPGTYDYFSFPAWRAYFRSTRAHNTLAIDDLDQSTMLGPFLWGQRAQARCVRWEPNGDGGTVGGEHDGYGRLRDPVRHRRTLALDARSRTLTIRDEIVARGQHDVAVYFHLAEHCTWSVPAPNRYLIAAGGGSVVLEIDARLAVQAVRGTEEPIAGWVSRGYHRKVPATTIVGRHRCDGTTTFTCRIEIGSPP